MAYQDITPGDLFKVIELGAFTGHCKIAIGQDNTSIVSYNQGSDDGTHTTPSCMTADGMRNVLETGPKTARVR